MMENRHKILVVDDDPKALELIKALLIPAGYSVVTLADSTKMINTVRQVEPDLILLDIMMPVLDGYTVLHIIKKEETIKNIPVVMVSALGRDGDKIVASIYGASAYITKPINSKQLIETIARFMPDSAS
jgi:CheY-like chemotaxis protein